MENYETKIDVSVETKRDWEDVGRYIFYALVLLLPVWILPFAGYAVGFSKSLLINVLVVAAAICYLVNVLQKGSVSIVKNFIFWCLVAVVAASLISAIFSENISVSLLGNGSETGTFVFVFVLSAALLLISSLFRSEKKALRFLLLIIFSSIPVFIFFFFHSVLNFNISPWGIFSRMDGPLGSWNEVAVFSGFIALQALIFFEYFTSDVKRLKIFLLGIAVFSLLVMAVVNFTLAWMIFGGMLLLFLIYLYLSSKESRSFARFPLFIVLLALFFVLARALVGDLTSSLGLDYFEVRPSLSATSMVTKDVMKEGVKNAILGSGPNTFVYDWLKFKPTEINKTEFWNAKFNFGSGLISSFPATSGILGGLAWLIFLAAVFYSGIKSVSCSGSELTKTVLVGSFLGSVYLWVFSVVYSPGNFLFALAFILTGVFLAMLINSQSVKVKEYFLVKNSGAGFVSALVIVFMLIGSVAGLYLFFQKYWSAYVFSRGLAVFNSSGDLDKAQNNFISALRFDQQDRYYASLAEVGLIRMSQVLNQSLTPEEMRAQFQNLLAGTIQNAQAAANLNPMEPENWMLLGRVYESIMPFQVQGSYDFAKDSYLKASERNPHSPVPFLSLARAEIQMGNLAPARSFLNLALEQKSDYTPALFLLAQLESQEGNLKEAIKRTEQALLTAPNDIGVLFQLGLLYYQNKEYSNARIVLERTVALSANYSNARYFLGLVYGNLDKTTEAIEQFERIAELNPDNAEVEQIIANLKAGKNALSGISPPAPAPENREEPPLE